MKNLLIIFKILKKMIIKEIIQKKINLDVIVLLNQKIIKMLMIVI